MGNSLAALEGLDPIGLAAFVALGRRNEWWADWLPPGVDAGVLQSLDARGLVMARACFRDSNGNLGGTGWHSPNKNRDQIGDWNEVMRNHLKQKRNASYVVALSQDGMGIWKELVRGGRVQNGAAGGSVAAKHSVARDLAHNIDSVLDSLELLHRAEFNEPPIPTPSWWRKFDEPVRPEPVPPSDGFHQTKPNRVQSCHEQALTAIDHCLSKWDNLAALIPVSPLVETRLLAAGKRALSQVRATLGPLQMGRPWRVGLVPHERQLVWTEPLTWEPEPIPATESQANEAYKRLCFDFVKAGTANTPQAQREIHRAERRHEWLVRQRAHRDKKRSVGRVLAADLEILRARHADWREVIQRWNALIREVTEVRDALFAPAVSQSVKPPADLEGTPTDLRPAIFFVQAVKHYSEGKAAPLRMHELWRARTRLGKSGSKLEKRLWYYSVSRVSALLEFGSIAPYLNKAFQDNFQPTKANTKAKKRKRKSSITPTRRT